MTGIRQIAWTLGLALALAICGAAAADDQPGLTDEQRQLNLDSFDQVWTTIRDQHWEERPGGLDWEAVADELRPRVEQASTTDEARAVMIEMIDRLDQSHFNIIPAGVYSTLRGEGGDGTTGIKARVIDGQAVVFSVDHDSPAAKAGVRPGWVISSVGKQSLDPVIEQVFEEFSDSRYLDFVLASAVMGRLSGPVDEQLTIRFLDERNRKIKRKLRLEQQQGKQVQLGFMPPFYVWIEHSTLEGNVGYIAFNMFMDPGALMPEFNRAMQEFSSTEGLVIDLRGNPGGLIGMGMGMAGWLVDEKNQRLGTMYTRNNELKVVVLPRPDTYEGPVAILVDGLSGSCSEIVAGGLQDLGRARIFGAQTMGAVLPSAIEQLPNGDGFQYAFANYVSAGGEVLEGVGVVPDVEIAPTRDELLRGLDPTLDAAMAWIRTAN